MFDPSHSGALEVVVVKGTNLPGRDVYCKLRVGTTERRTYVKTQRNPCWDQKLMFNLKGGAEVAADGLKLRISIMESNTFTADEWLGGVEIPLTQLKHNETSLGVVDISRDKQSRQLTIKLCWRSYQHVSVASASPPRAPSTQRANISSAKSSPSSAQDLAAKGTRLSQISGWMDKFRTPNETMKGISPEAAAKPKKVARETDAEAEGCVLQREREESAATDQIEAKLAVDHKARIRSAESV
jgi:hypothetical protein